MMSYSRFVRLFTSRESVVISSQKGEPGRPGSVTLYKIKTNRATLSIVKQGEWGSSVARGRSARVSVVFAGPSVPCRT